MNILALETSSARQSICLWEEGAIRWEREFVVPRRASGPLFSFLEELLSLVGRKVDGLVVGTGPGSYNGLRAGLAAGQGLRFSMRVPLLGRSSLLALPWPSYHVAGDARSGQFFRATVENRSLVHSPQLVKKLPVQESLDLPQVWIGEFPPTGWQASYPRASLLAALVAEEFAERGEWAGEAAPEIIYLKPPHITTPNQPFSVAEDRTRR